MRTSPRGRKSRRLARQLAGASSLALLLAALLASPPALATTYHSLTVDGDLGDFAADEQTAGDPLGDHAFGPENDLSDLYLSWDAERLYLGLRYQAEQTAVITLIETGASGGVSDLCPGAGYSGAFPANLRGPGFDLMLAFFAPADHGVAPSAFLYTLEANASTDVSSSPGVALQLSETVSVSGRQGALEAAIPWSLIYGLGNGQVPSGAQLRVAGVLRGKTDGDGLGDVSPDPSGAVSTAGCGGPATVLDIFHTITVDANGDGQPDSGWAPGPDRPAGTTDGPLPDLGPAPDTRPADLTPTPDSPRPDSTPAADQATTDSPVSGADGPASGLDGPPAAADGGTDLGQPQPDQGFVAGTQEEGCACALTPRSGGALPGALLALLALLALCRRLPS